MTVIKKQKGDFFDDAYTLLHPTRFRIVKLLNEKPMHIGDISRVLDVERHLIGMHLDILKEYGFVSSEYVISEEKRLRGRATRIVRLTDKVAKVCSELQKELNAFITKKNSK
jgi:predicted ArsR family transcriptional regulator